MSILYPTSLKTWRSPSSTWSFSGSVLPNASIFDMAVRCGGTVVDSPIERGSFFSYNKTTEPLEITATLSFEGSDTLLQSVLSNLKTLKDSVTMFSIITPTYEYENMTLQNYDYSFNREQGLGVLYVNAVFKEIKEVTVAYTQQQTVVSSPITESGTADASAVSETQEGSIQAVTPSSTEQSAGEASARNVSMAKQMEEAGMLFF